MTIRTGEKRQSDQGVDQIDHRPRQASRITALIGSASSRTQDVVEVVMQGTAAAAGSNLPNLGEIHHVLRSITEMQEHEDAQSPVSRMEGLIGLASSGSPIATIMQVAMQGITPSSRRSLSPVNNNQQNARDSRGRRRFEELEKSILNLARKHHLLRSITESQKTIPLEKLLKYPLIDLLIGEKRVVDFKWVYPLSQKVFYVLSPWGIGVLHQLSLELLREIFTYLPLGSFLALASTSKTFRLLSFDSHYWQHYKGLAPDQNVTKTSLKEEIESWIKQGNNRSTIAGLKKKLQIDDRTFCLITAQLYWLNPANQDKLEPLNSEEKTALIYSKRPPDKQFFVKGLTELSKMMGSWVVFEDDKDNLFWWKLFCQALIEHTVNINQFNKDVYWNQFFPQEELFKNVFVKSVDDKRWCHIPWHHTYKQFVELLSMIVVNDSTAYKLLPDGSEKNSNKRYTFQFPDDMAGRRMADPLLIRRFVGLNFKILINGRTDYLKSLRVDRELFKNVVKDQPNAILHMHQDLFDDDEFMSEIFAIAPNAKNYLKDVGKITQKRRVQLLLMKP